MSIDWIPFFDEVVYILEIVSRRIYIKLSKSALEVKKGLKIEKQRGFIFSIIKNFQTNRSPWAIPK